MRKSVSALCLGIFCAVCLVHAQPEPVELELKSTWPGFNRGSARAVQVMGNQAYIAAQLGGLIIINISDPSNPTRTSGLDLGSRAVDLALAGDYAYVASEHAGLQVVNISDPLALNIVGQLRSGFISDVEISGSTVFGIGRTELQIIDVTNPSDPTLRSELNLNERPRDIEVHGNYVFLFIGSGGVLIVDIGDLANPRIVHRLSAGLSISDIELDGELLYVSSASILQIIDVSDPLKPKALHDSSSPVTFGSNVGVEVADGVAVVSRINEGIFLYDVSDPTGIRFLGSLSVPLPSRLEIVGDYAYVLAGFDLMIIDIRQPQSPTLASEFFTGGFTRDLEIRGDHVFVADEPAGLQILDASNLTNLIRVANVSEYARDIDLSGDIICVAARSHLSVIDVSNPFLPIFIGQSGVGAAAVNQVDVDGNLALTSSTVFDLGNPGAPRPIAGFPAGNYDIEIAGAVAFVAMGTDGVRVINISAPANPVELASVNIDGFATGIEIVDDLAFICAGRGGLQILDVSIPSAPEVIGSLPVSGWAEGVSIVGHLAYIADRQNGLSVADVADPEQPVSIAEMPLPGGAHDVEVLGNKVFVANGIWGVSVLESSIPQPNPPPVAEGGLFRTSEDIVIIGQLIGSDPEGESLTFSLEDDGVLGHVISRP